jgi:hypothetical protein
MKNYISWLEEVLDHGLEVLHLEPGLIKRWKA